SPGFPPCPVLGTGLGAAARRRREKGTDGAGLGVDRRKSKVWNYYRKLGDAYVECNVCKKQLSFHNSTTTMREHLVRKHSIRETLLSHIKDDHGAEPDSAAPENAAKRCRQTPPESGSHHAEARSDVLLELVLEMIFRDLHPLSVVKDKGFRLLLGYLEPGLVLPAPAQLAGMLRHRYSAARQHLERYLRTVQSVVVCAELWGSQLGQTYLSLTASFVDTEWRRARCVLETRPAGEEDAEGGLGEKLQAVLSEFGLSGRSVLCVVHESPRSAAVARGWRSLCCAARALHLCV
ncbi:RSLE3 protein, partial [Aegotheles bennettii]|nr:RSLE3 protein [Aegotheles bennettii]